MADEEDDVPELDRDDPGSYEDYVAARAIAHVKELEAAARFKDAGHDDLYREAKLMAEALRRSFRTRKLGTLEALDGGKQESN